MIRVGLAAIAGAVVGYCCCALLERYLARPWV